MTEALDEHRIAEEWIGIAGERIAEAARTGQDWLGLGNLGLTHLPTGLLRPTELRRLNLAWRDRLTVGSWPLYYPGTLNDRPNRIAADLPRLVALVDFTEFLIDDTDRVALDGPSALTWLVRLVIMNIQVSDLSPLRDHTVTQCHHLLVEPAPVRTSD